MTIPRYNKCTIWAAGETDPRTGAKTLGDARVYKCEVKRGGKIKYADKTGSEFYPSSTFWVRLSDLVTGVHIEPNEGEMIAQGDQLAITNPADVSAEIIKAVVIHNHVKFNESESYTIATSS
jgi:translation elongation factor EF-Tu-like GTPase